MAAHRHPSRPRVARRVASSIGTFALVAVSLAAVAFVLPAGLGFQRYVITGGSMSGTYDKGSVVFERTVPAADLEVGDVITYQPPAASGVTTLVTHRVIGIKHDAQGRQVLRTQGDATTVSVLNAQGAPESSANAQRIVQVIADDLK